VDFQHAARRECETEIVHVAPGIHLSVKLGPGEEV
jgi:hypothetical protein